MNKNINDFQVSRYFNLREFCSPDTSELKISKRLVEICEELRNDTPLIVTSGYRTPEHNKKAGGHKKSYHLAGLAADLKPTLNSLENLFILASSFPDIGGLGIYVSGIIHIDLRDNRKFWVSWTTWEKKKRKRHYKYFSNPDSALKCWRLNIDKE